MVSYNLLIISFVLFIKLSKQDIAAPVFTPDNESIKNQQIDQSDAKAKSIGENLQASEIVNQLLIANAPSTLNQTAQKVNQNNSNKSRKRKYQINKQYRPNSINERKNQFDPLAYNLDAIKKNQLNELNNAMLIQLANQKLTNNQDSLDNKYNPLLSSLSNNDLPFQLVPIYATESPTSNLLNNADSNQLAVQLYLRKLAQLAALQKQSLERTERQPKIQKRVSNQQSSSSSPSNLQQYATLNQLLQSEAQPIYTLLQPQQTATSSQSNPLYLALQPSFPVLSNNNQREPSPQVSSIIETGDKIFAKIKQWSTDIFNPKSSLNRQINEVLGVVSDVALVTLIGVPVVSLLSLGLSTLMTPLSQLNRKVDRTKSATNKLKTKEEKKDKDEKTAKSDTSHAQKNTKMLDKRSRLVSLVERAGDEFNHFKNIVEIAKNFELAFKKFNVMERECKYRALCEISSTNQQVTETGSTVLTSTVNSSDHAFVSNNLLSEGRKKRSIKSTMQSTNEKVAAADNQLKTIDCEQSNCSKTTVNKQADSTSSSMSNSSSNSSSNNSSNSSNNVPTSTSPAKDNSANFLLNQLKYFERNLVNQRGTIRNFIRNLNLDKFINENKESFVGFISTIDQLMNKAQRSNLYNYLVNEDQFNQAFRSDKLFRTIAERSKHLQDKLRDFLDNLTSFQQVVSKESQNLDNKASTKYKMFNYYNLRSKRTASLNGAPLSNETRSIMNNNLELSNENSDQNVDVSGLKGVLIELINQLKHEQHQDNLILPLSRIWLNPYMSAFEYGSRHTTDQCKSRYFKCTINFLGLNNGNLARRLDYEISEISNNHLLRQSVKKKPELKS